MNGDGSQRDEWITPEHFLVQEGFSIDGIDRQQLILTLKRLRSEYEQTIHSHSILPEETQTQNAKHLNIARKKIQIISDILHRAGAE
jgi:hypothetical protein